MGDNQRREPRPTHLAWPLRRRYGVAVLNRPRLRARALSRNSSEVRITIALALSVHSLPIGRAGKATTAHRHPPRCRAAAIDTDLIRDSLDGSSRLPATVALRALDGESGRDLARYMAISLHIELIQRWESLPNGHFAL